MCKNLYDCNSHGECLETKCYCDAGWFEYDCSLNLKDLWIEAYFTYRAFFILLFAILTLYSLLSL